MYGASNLPYLRDFLTSAVRTSPAGVILPPRIAATPIAGAPDSPLPPEKSSISTVQPPALKSLTTSSVCAFFSFSRAQRSIDVTSGRKGGLSGPAFIKLYPSKQPAGRLELLIAL